MHRFHTARAHLARCVEDDVASGLLVVTCLVTGATISAGLLVQLVA
ncbi:hypothetical protein JOE61_003007 [Nocardioides salarius]|uniref:Uncharacterized protein n=1 Tax=Nocardioides salarius TaxID=374513 RepID=A0ABS2MDD0_9ACTN|nr:hypothetical protein [Nocardioides salarius]MBM7509193.1 hypothetical protein [Nocardioides salarius]